MKDKEEYTLEEAIKNNYRTAPLRINLPAVVAETVFEERKRAAFDRQIHLLAGGIHIVVMAFCIGYLYKISAPPVLLLLIIPAACYFWLSFKEYMLSSASGHILEGSRD